MTAITLQFVWLSMCLNKPFSLISTIGLKDWLLQDTPNCSGELFVSLFGLAVISSFLILFIRFFIQTYSKKKKKRS